jgi:hypothetical protein
LPALVEAAAAEAAEHLRQGIEASIAMAARDFVGQRGQLQLPLDEPAGAKRAQPIRSSSDRVRITARSLSAIRYNARS